VKLGGDLNWLEMLYQFLLLLAISEAANFDDTCTVMGDVQCTDTQDEYTWKHSKGKPQVQLGFCQG
jgi:hypothetical protein